jgi:hypothetical protein
VGRAASVVNVMAWVAIGFVAFLALVFGLQWLAMRT